jgi:hypothetical protein
VFYQALEITGPVGFSPLISNNSLIFSTGTDFQEMLPKLFSRLLFALTASTILNLDIKSKTPQIIFKAVRGFYTGLNLSRHAKKDPKNLVRHSL